METAALMTDGDATEATFSPDERILCPDEMCTGILDPDGRCGTCGRIVPLGPRASLAVAAQCEAEHPVEELETSQDPADELPPTPKVVGLDEDLDPDERVPCRDDMCTGILDSSGRCGTCGLTWR